MDFHFCLITRSFGAFFGWAKMIGCGLMLCGHSLSSTKSFLLKVTQRTNQCLTVTNKNCRIRFTAQSIQSNIKGIYQHYK